jgi:YgiT-type zinc finger domain-containing protein
MKCDVCGKAEREHRLIQYHFPQGEQLVVVDNVPADVCPNCGEVSLSPETVQRLQETVWDRRGPSRLVETRVYEFTQ